MLFATPDLDAEDIQVITEIETLRSKLRLYIREPKRWKGQLRRNLKARAIRGSNSIEGYDVSLDDALALVDDDEEVVDADKRTVLEIVGYRNALTYIQQLAEDQHFSLDESLIRSLHFMMLGHDLSKSPGRYRLKEIFVHDEEHDLVVYEGPEPEMVPDLMQELVVGLPGPDDCPVFVRAAMAHLNLVMIHPFRDGNGRMARALQTLVLAREHILAPEFSSIEEWLGRNTTAYYAVLAEVGAGSWQPQRSARSWMRFNLVAHHMQAQTVLRRVEETSRLWRELEELIREKGLPERTIFAIYPAALGYRVRRTTYEGDAEVELGTANRDLRMMVDAGMIAASGETRGRYYLGTPATRDVWKRAVKDRARLVDPYPSGNKFALQLG